MHGRYGRLKAEGTESAAKRLLYQRKRFFNLGAVPSATILLFQYHHIACMVDTGIASRIVRVSRTGRCVMVVVGNRNARAISSVSSPQSVRNVSATWASGASAGWQQVKIKRRRSSGIAVSS